MDPNATLAAYWAAVRDGDKDEAREHKANLKAWLARGGFAPDWTRGGHSRAEFMTGKKGSPNRTVTAADVLGRPHKGRR